MADKKVKEYGELKRRAMLAKQRLKMGYWQKMCEEKREALDKLGDIGGNQRLVSEIQLDKVRRDEHRAFCSDQADKEEFFYFKVCSILDKDENVINPIGQLIDKNEYDKLDDDARQRYILKLSQKFRDMRERYYRERAGKSG